MLTQSFIKKYTPDIYTNPIKDPNPRKAIINIGSYTQECFVTQKPAFNASKQLTWSFFASEWMNYKELGYDMITLCPVNVSTKMNNFMKEGFLTCSPKELVQSGLKALGHVESTFGTWKHQIYAYVYDFVRVFCGAKASKTFDAFVN